MIAMDGEITSESVTRVMTGVEWLDQVHPGWERKIDVSTLDITDACSCVIGQVTGTWDSFRVVVRSVFGEVGSTDWHNWIGQHGFSFAEDTETWLLLIKSRFDTGILSDN